MANRTTVTKASFNGQQVGDAQLPGLRSTLDARIKAFAQTFFQIAPGEQFKLKVTSKKVEVQPLNAHGVPNGPARTLEKSAAGVWSRTDIATRAIDAVQQDEINVIGESILNRVEVAWHKSAPASKEEAPKIAKKAELDKGPERRPASDGRTQDALRRLEQREEELERQLERLRNQLERLN